MVDIKNDQQAIAINTSELKKKTLHLLRVIEYSDYGLGIMLTTPAKMHAFNKKFRGIDKPTDILSFMYYQDLKPNERIRPESEEDKYLGDIIMCPEYIAEHLDAWPEKSVGLRIERLLVHGICHLLGYTHETDSNAKTMLDQETYLLSKLQ